MSEFDDDAAPKLKADDEKADFRWLMKDKRGRRVMNRLIEYCCMNRTAFSTNALQMAHDEGRRRVGLWLTDMVKTYAFKSYLTMIEENDERNDDTNG